MPLLWAIENLTLRDFVDITLVASLFFSASFLFRGTQAVALLRGTLVVLAGLIAVSGVFELRALRWLLSNGVTVLAVALPVIFQPELRRALERLGRAGFFPSGRAPSTLYAKIVEDVCSAVERLAERRHGALVVLERDGNLDEYIRSGVLLDCEVSAEVLLTVFAPKTELHDGAAIVDRRARLAAAACVLPLSAARNLPNRKQGTRHRAGLGISEVSDAVCIIVSEETGRVSVAHAGRIMPRLDVKRLRTILLALYIPESRTLGWWGRSRQWVGQRLPSRAATPRSPRS